MNNLELALILTCAAVGAWWLGWKFTSTIQTIFGSHVSDKQKLNWIKYTLTLDQNGSAFVISETIYGIVFEDPGIIEYCKYKYGD